MLSTTDARTAVERLLEELDPSGEVVASYVPARHQAHIRVLNPVMQPGREPRPWTSELPEGVVLRSDSQWSEVSGGSAVSRQAEPSTGTVDATVLDRLITTLTDDARSLVVVAQWAGYADAIIPREAADALLPPERPSKVWMAPASDVASLNRVPMRIWDPALRWAIGNDIYGRSVFVSGDAEVLDRLLTDPGVESVRVSATDPVSVEDL